MNFIYKNLFDERQHVSEHDINNFLNVIPKFLQLSTEQSLECEKYSTEKEPFEALKSVPNGKYPGNDGLTIDFLETFSSEVKKHFYYVFYTLLVKKNSEPHKDKQL